MIALIYKAHSNPHPQLQMSQLDPYKHMSMHAVCDPVLIASFALSQGVAHLLCRLISHGMRYTRGYQSLCIDTDMEVDDMRGCTASCQNESQSKQSDTKVGAELCQCRLWFVICNLTFADSKVIA